MKGLGCNFLCEPWAGHSPEAGQPPRAVSLHSAQRLGFPVPFSSLFCKMEILLLPLQEELREDANCILV